MYVAKRDKIDIIIIFAVVNIFTSVKYCGHLHCTGSMCMFPLIH